MTENAELLPPQPDPDALDVAGRINYHYRAALDNYQAAHEHALRCGWELAIQKDRIGWGGWRKWIKENLEFSKDTADRLIAFYEDKIGTERKRIGIALINDLTAKELEAATAGLSGKSVTAAMIEAGVRTRSTNWGGDRSAAAAANGNRVGRPPTLPADGVTDGIRKAAVARWGDVSRNAGYFLAHKFELALTLPEARAAQKTVQALQDAIARRIAELERRP